MTAKPYRLQTDYQKQNIGNRIKIDKKYSFKFDNTEIEFYQGDTIASALLANGVRVISRSFKYHRPRSLMGIGSEEPNALLEIGKKNYHIPNICATEVYPQNGIFIRSQNNWPSVKSDFGQISDALSRFIPAGFYYKTFKWPPKAWTLYEYFIRRAAGLGSAAKTNDTQIYEHLHYNCDIIVIGAGIAGLAAAYAAASVGAHVLIVDEQNITGGNSDLYQFSKQTYQEIENITAKIKNFDNCKILTNTTAIGLYDHRYILLNEKINQDNIEICSDKMKPSQRLWKIRAKKIIVASGALERPLVFANNDRPGVMLSSAIRGYLKRYAVVPGRRGVIFTNNNDAYHTAFMLAENGIKINSIVDLRDDIMPELHKKARENNIEIFTGHAIVNITTSGFGNNIDKIFIAALLRNGRIGKINKIPADFVAVSGGFNPIAHLYCHIGGKMQYDRKIASFRPANKIDDVETVGACDGEFEIDKIIQKAFLVGEKFARQYKKNKTKQIFKIKINIQTDLEYKLDIKENWFVPSISKYNKGNRHFVDFQNDVTVADIELAVREGYDSIEHLKRYTTLGMATDQGRTSNNNALGVFADTTGEDLTQSITTTFRPPYKPLTFGAIAGTRTKSLFEPTRHTPIHKYHKQNTVDFETIGQWIKPYCYRNDDETRKQAVDREVIHLRNNVALFDASTLGKIEVKGLDASKFLDLIYSNNISSLKVGHCRYALMLNENGFIFDDGVVVKIASEHYLIHTTSGNADRVFNHLNFWIQTEWRDLRVFINNVTEQYGQIVVAGPNSRILLQSCGFNIDFSKDKFGFMQTREGKIDKIAVRVHRISFSGELSYEIAIDSNYALSLWEKIFKVGTDNSLVVKAYGTEALHVLRAEKGFVVIGDETDGTVTPYDLGFGNMVSTKKPDFIGKHSLELFAELTRKDRKHLVGLLNQEPLEVIPDGAYAIAQNQTKSPLKTIGHVTSSYYSPTLKRSIALAMIENGKQRQGDTITIQLKDKNINALIVSPIFYDQKSERQNV